MEKKYLIVGMAVLLGVSLSFFGCDDSTKEAAEPSAAEKAATALAEKLGADFAEASGTTVTLKKSTSIADNVTVEAGVTLAVPKQTSAITLTVGTGKTLTVAEGGSLTVAEGAAVSVTGTYTLDEGATVTNNGTVTIKSGGVSKSHDNENSAGATGFTVVETGGKAYFRDNLYFGDTTAANFQLGANSTFSFNKAGYVLNGTATLNGITGHLQSSGWSGKGWGLYAKDDNGQQLTLKANSTLTIPGNTILDLNGTAEKQAIIGEAGASVVAQAHIQLWIYTGINFYSSAGNALTGKSFDTGNGTPKTFNWAADADTSTEGNQPGWKATS
jgi:hypothetical protein